MLANQKPDYTLVQHKMESYTWTDNEVTLPLDITLEFKVSETLEDAVQRFSSSV